jgi:hypothetical protein|tara:strand:- start:150 stop:257 length:108 start_codon:yes stop_codon:yes gene_type:complete
VNQQTEIIVYYEKAVKDDADKSVSLNEISTNGDGQ